MGEKYESKICDNRTGRIVGGREARAHKWPWQVAVFRDFKFGNGLEIACGGSILSNIWVVSASHCFYNCPDDEEAENYDAKCTPDFCPYKKKNEAENIDYMLKFGEHDLSNTDEE